MVLETWSMKRSAKPGGCGWPMRASSPAAPSRIMRGPKSAGWAALVAADRGRLSSIWKRPSWMAAITAQVVEMLRRRSGRVARAAATSPLAAKASA